MLDNTSTAEPAGPDPIGERCLAIATEIAKGIKGSLDSQFADDLATAFREWELRVFCEQQAELVPALELIESEASFLSNRLVRSDLRPWLEPIGQEAPTPFQLYQSCRWVARRFAKWVQRPPSQQT